MDAEQALLEISKILERYLTPSVVSEKKFIALDEFQIVWSKYPSTRRDNKPKCLAVFLKTVKSHEDCDRITKALNYYLSSDDVSRGYIKLSSTWFPQWETFWENYNDTKDTSGILKHMGPK